MGKKRQSGSERSRLDLIARAGYLVTRTPLTYLLVCFLVDATKSTINHRRGEIRRGEDGERAAFKKLIITVGPLLSATN